VLRASVLPGRKYPISAKSRAAAHPTALARELVWLEQHIDTWDSRGNPGSEEAGCLPSRLLRAPEISP